MSSLLNDIKLFCGLTEEQTVFDVQFLMIINSLLAILCQIGIGPEEGFSINDSLTTWDDFIGDDPRFNTVKTYLCVKTKLIFDPPSNSTICKLYEDVVKEFEWRSNISAEAIPVNSEGEENE